MRRVGLIVLLLMGWFVMGRADAQDATPSRFRDYVLSTPTVTFSPDETTFTIRFTVTNQGANAEGPSTVSVTDASAQNVIKDQSDVLRPLNTSETQVFTYTLQSADFPPNSTQIFQIEAGLSDGFEVPGTDIARNNAFPISVTIPAITRQPGQSTPVPSTESPSSSPVPAVNDIIQSLLALIPQGNMQVGPVTIPQNMALALGLALGALLLWFVFVILRMIFRRPQKMGLWQPPYGTMPTMDPNSVAGRRQAWQSHAQNGTILAAPTEGNLHPIKLLVGQQGDFMKGWRVTGMRLSQYDGYGRVGRTETIAPTSLVKSLNRVLLNNHRYDGDALNKRIRPVARAFVKQMRRNMTKRTMHLPVAMDLRFEGKQGEVHIAFELYQCQNQAWHRLDRWEPLMTVIGKRLIENYTYTIHGQSSGETTREFFARLPEDVEWLLGETIRSRAVAAPDAPPAPQPTYEVPDTVSGMQPVVDRPR